MQKPGLKSFLILVLILFIVILTVLIKSCGKNGDKIYIFEKADVGEVKKTISVTGELNLQQPVFVLSKVGGVVERINAGVNQYVSKGQLLVQIDSDGIDQRLKKTQSSLESVKYEIMKAEKDLDGKKNLFKDNLISRNAMEQAEMEYQTVLLKYKQTKLDYDMILSEKQNTRVYSPISGIVISVNVQLNAAISASSNMMLLTSSLKEMQLTINIDESDIGRVKSGQKVFFSVSAFPDKTFNGVINQVMINPVKSGALVSYQAIVLCNNEELLLKPGMTATATVVIDQKSAVLRVQNQAFIISPDEDFVNEPGKKYIWKKNGKVAGNPYTRIEVMTGLVGDMHTEITSGIKAGDEVLIKIQEPK